MQEPPAQKRATAAPRPAGPPTLAATSSRAAAAALRKAEEAADAKLLRVQTALDTSKQAERTARGRCAGMVDALRRVQSEKRAAADDAEALRKRVAVQKRSIAALQGRVAVLEHTLAKARSWCCLNAKCSGAVNHRQRWFWTCFQEPTCSKLDLSSR